MAFAWKESYSVRVPHIDDQHKQLIALIAQAEATTAQKPFDPLRARGVLNDIVAYTLFHFRDEEALMRDVGYPELGRHKALHDSFAQRIKSINDAFVGGRGAAFAEVHGLLRKWLLEHIVQEDKKIGLHVIRTREEPRP